MLLPLSTSIRPTRTPYANYLLIAANVFVFFITYSPHYFIKDGATVLEPLRNWADTLMLTPTQPQLAQFITYAFLHGGFIHLFGNMFFLYLFGNNVNDKLGSIGYLCFYLAGAVFSGVGHTLLNNSPALGASGAVAAVTGAYLVLFPQTLITIVYWFFFIGTMEVPALYFIAFKMIFIDNMLARYTPNVAYDAHLAGYAFGIAGTLLLFATGIIGGSGFDLWTMIKQWNRRRHYRDIVTGYDYDPFTGQSDAKWIKAKEVEKPAQIDEKTQQLRNEISLRTAQHNLHAAVELYLELMGLDNSQLLPLQNLLDIANQLASEKRYDNAAAAYEQFLANYGSYEHAEQVQLMLGIMYSRYLNKPQLAVNHLKSAAEKLTDPGQLKMCRDELARLQ
jgi:hypothetical protein